jgi:hypothetical protein
MNKIERPVDVANLDAVAYFEEDFVLYIDSNDENIPTSLCVQANFESLQFDPVQPISVFLESRSYMPLIDVDARISQRQRLLDEMHPDVIAAMLDDFNEKKRLIQKNITPFSEILHDWQSES